MLALRPDAEGNRPGHAIVPSGFWPGEFNHFTFSYLIAVAVNELGFPTVTLKE